MPGSIIAWSLLGLFSVVILVLAGWVPRGSAVLDRLGETALADETPACRICDDRPVTRFVGDTGVCATCNERYFPSA